MLIDPSTMIKIHSRYLMVTEYSWCCWMVTKIQSPHNCGDQKPFGATIFFPSPHPHFFFLLCFPPLMAIETLFVAILCDPFIKKWGY